MILIHDMFLMQGTMPLNHISWQHYHLILLKQYLQFYKEVSILDKSILKGFNDQ